MQRYEIATLNTALGGAAKAAPGIESFCREGSGRLLGCWATEIGPLNQVLILRGFDTAGDAAKERERTLRAASPFGAAEVLNGMTLDGYAPFPFLPPVEPGEYGSVYEIRTYVLKTGGVEPTIAAWEAAIPARVKYSPLTIAMYALDGAPRFTHIWPFKSLNDRAAVRAQTVADGVWPPKGGPAWLTTDMRSTIGLPLPVSPLR